MGAAMALKGNPARLVYVMGPSGAGKDSVLRYARRELDGRYPVVFAHRYITRPPGNDIEDYIALSPGEFELRHAHGVFALNWDAYGWRYGIGSEINLWRAAGLTVVIDGSRHHFLQHGAALAQALPVLITAPTEILRQRLIARKREDAAAIDQRLERGRALEPLAPNLVTIDNTGPLEQAGARLAALLREQAE
jgi:ribose 1,5-bisphosphokinase